MYIYIYIKKKAQQGQQSMKQIKHITTISQFSSFSRTSTKTSKINSKTPNHITTNHSKSALPSTRSTLNTSTEHQSTASKSAKPLKTYNRFTTLHTSSIQRAQHIKSHNHRNTRIANLIILTSRNMPEKTSPPNQKTNIQEPNESKRLLQIKIEALDRGERPSRNLQSLRSHRSPMPPSEKKTVCVNQQRFDEWGRRRDGRGPRSFI